MRPPSRRAPGVRRGARFGARRWLAAAALVGLVGLCLLATKARADVVDEAYAAGSEAVRAGQLDAATTHWRRALELLPGRSAQLEYDLGTLYAQRGELGWATYHLERALVPEARPTAELAELARRNLAVVRSQAELAAEVADAHISREESWWDLLVAVLAGRTLAWISTVAAWLLVLALALRSWQRRRDPSASGSGVTGAAALVLALVFVIGGGLHGLAIYAAAGHPDAIALDELTDVHEAPGVHAPVAFRLQGGSRVRVLETRSDWVHLRLPGGLEGWANAGSVARLDQAPP